MTWTNLDRRNANGIYIDLRDNLFKIVYGWEDCSREIKCKLFK